MGGGASLRDDIAEVLVTEDQLAAALDRLATELTEDFGDRRPILVGVLTGVFVFMADLVRRLDFPLEIEFVCARSYGSRTEAAALAIELDLSCDITGRHVVLIDDILDTGRTLQKLVELLRNREPASVSTCCMLDKRSRRTVDFEADYVGVEIPDRFVVGYGLDFARHHRNLPFIAVLRQELYDNPRE